MTTTKEMTIKQLLQIQPELVEIVKVAKAESTIDIDLAYVHAKQKSGEYVGWGSKNESTQTEYAYILFINYLCDKIGY